MAPVVPSVPLRPPILSAPRRETVAGRAARDRVYTFIAGYVARYGRPPTLRDIAAACQLASVSTAAYHVERLAEEGRIIRYPGSKRGIALPSHVGAVLHIA